MPAAFDTLKGRIEAAELARLCGRSTCGEPQAVPYVRTGGPKVR